MDTQIALDLLPGYALAQSYRVLRHAMDDALRDLGLTTPQWGALARLEQNEGISGAEMARIHHLTPQTMNTILHNLEDAGLIVREHHPEHGTVLQVRLTDAGRQCLAEATARVNAVQERMLGGLDQAERALLNNLLQRCTQTLCGEGPRGGMPCRDEEVRTRPPVQDGETDR